MVLTVKFSTLIHLVLSLFPSHPGTVTQVCTPTLLACSRRLDEREWFEGCWNYYSYGHLLVIIAGYKWDYTFYKWVLLLLITGITRATTVDEHGI